MTNRAKRRRIVGERHLEHDLDTLGTLCRHFPLTFGVAYVVAEQDS